jgi:hypothetical protein
MIFLPGVSMDRHIPEVNPGERRKEGLYFEFND